MDPIIKPEKFKEVSGITSLASFPKNIKLDEQNNDEYILLFVRQHKVVLYVNLILQIFVFVLFVGCAFLINRLDSFFLNGVLQTKLFLESKYWWVVILCLVSFTLSNLFDTFYRWFYNVNILTTEKFIDIDLNSIFSSRVEAASLLDIEDAKDTQNGIIHTIFNMGNVTVLTASGGTVFSLDNVPRAHKVRDFIMDTVILIKRIRGNNRND